ncbi:cytidylyltransferase domain-containing protein [Peribacillus asahii]|uniref:acylneuraminate cytidylyltransferase family protein n=1 Tax=Peribacillus asahii TaxID=228899 RepID=UPI0037F5AEA2
MNNLFIVPARGGSKRLPGKNIKSLCSKPLISYTIEAAIHSEIKGRILVTTDEENIASTALKHGAEVPFLRPSYLSDDQSKSIDVVTHAVEFYEGELNYTVDNIILLQPTSPLRTSKDIKTAFELYLKHDCFPVISVMERNLSGKYFIKNEEGYALKIDMNQEGYELNGAIYIIPRENLKQGYFYKDRFIPYIMPYNKSIDIDTAEDFALAKMYMEQGELK